MTAYTIRRTLTRLSVLWMLILLLSIGNQIARLTPAPSQEEVDRRDAHNRDMMQMQADTLMAVAQAMSEAFNTNSAPTQPHP